MLVRVCIGGVEGDGRENSYSLLVGIEISLEIPQKIKNRTSIGFSHNISGYILKTIKAGLLQKTPAYPCLSWYH
jgi:hypothetical protein